MNLRRLLVLTLFLFPAAAPAAEQLGKVNFPTSCDPKVQAHFERGVAMLHSFWFGAGKKRSAMCWRKIRHAP